MHYLWCSNMHCHLHPFTGAELQNSIWGSRGGWHSFTAGECVKCAILIVVLDVTSSVGHWGHGFPACAWLDVCHDICVFHLQPIRATWPTRAHIAMKPIILCKQCWFIKILCQASLFRYFFMISKHSMYIYSSTSNVQHPVIGVLWCHLSLYNYIHVHNTPHELLKYVVCVHAHLLIVSNAAKHEDGQLLWQDACMPSQIRINLHAYCFS